MNLERDEAVLEAVHRRQARIDMRIEEEAEAHLRERSRRKKRWIRRSLLPSIAVMAPLIPLGMYGLPFVVFIVLPLTPIWLTVCALNLTQCISWGRTRPDRIALGIVLFFGLILLNAVFLYAVVFTASAVD